ncbi:MAG: outer membrane beta-barrel protein [Kiloniellaceae bacterium]
MLVAEAQEGEVPVAVFDKSRSGYDAKGIDLGGFRLFPRAAVSEGYDDNIFADDNDEEADLITTVSAALLAESEWSRHGLSVDARLRHQRFLDNDEQDRTEFFVRPELRLDLAERSEATLVTEYSRRVVGRDDPEDAGNEEPTEFDRFYSRAEVIGRANRMFFGLNGEVRRDDYVSTGDDDRDRTEYRFGLPLGYEVSAKTDVVLEPFFRLRDFDEVDDTGADRDAQAAGATIGIDTEVSSLLHVNFDVGFIANEFEDSRFDDSVDLIFGGEAIWYATAMTTVKARAVRQDIATGETGASSKTQSLLGLEVQHELQRNVLLGAEIRYINDDFRDLDRNDDRAIVGVEAEYLINRHVSLAADYRYEQRWSTLAGEDFSRNIVTLGLRTRF